MKRISRILVFILSVAILCTALVMITSAEGTTFDLAAAISNAKDGDTITMTGNATLTTSVNVNKNLTIDLGGYNLTLKAADAFVINTASVDLTICGSGKIITGGVIANVNASDSDFSIIGDSVVDRINIVYDGSVQQRMLTVGANANGNVTFKNASVVSKYHPDAMSKDGEVILSEGTAKLTFTNFDFLCDVKYKGKISNADKEQSFTCVYFVKIVGDGRLAIKDSSINTTGGGVIINGLYAETSADVIVSVENSTLRTISYDGLTRAMAFYSGGMYDKPAKSRGTVLIKDSVVETSYALFNGGLEAESYVPDSLEPSTVFEIQNSTVAITSVNCGHSEHYTTSRGGTLRFDSNSKLATPGASSLGVNINQANAGFCFAEGARISTGSTTKLQTSDTVKFPDGSNAKSSTTYKLVFDPAGDPFYPWVVVKLVDGKLPTGINDAAAGLTLNTDFWYSDFSDFRGKVTDDWRDLYISGDGAFSKDSSLSGKITGGLFSAIGLEFQSNFYGTFNSAYINGNEAFRYIVSPLDSAPNATTRDYSDKDNYFVMGQGRKGLMLMKDYKVFAFDIDIGTDSGIYPQISRFAVAGRYTNSDGVDSGNLSGVGISIAPDGTLTFGDVTKSLSTEDWNRITAVCYMDSSYAEKGVVYYYLNGELLGHTDAYIQKDDTSYMQGFRINIAKTQQTVGSSIVFDNLTIRCYKNYLGNAEADANGALKTPDPALYNFFDADTYAVSKTYSLCSVASVNGKVYSNLNEAMSVAAQSGHPVKLLKDVSQVVRTGGYILTNGYEFNALTGSTTCTPHKDADGNVYAYTVDSGNSYELNLKFVYDGKTYGPVAATVGSTPSKLFGGDAPKVSTVKIDGHWGREEFIGWSYTENSKVADASDPITIPFAEKNNGKVITLYPVYTELTPYAWAVEKADGTLRTYGDETYFDSAVWTKINLAANETFIVQNDEIRLACTVTTKSASSTKTEIFNFDLNGHVLYSDWRNNSSNTVSYGTFTPNKYDTYNVFSSREGGYLVDIGNNTTSDYTRKGGDIFRVSNANVGLNVGDVEVNGVKYSGKNLTINGTSIVRLHGNAQDAKVNVKGCTLIKSFEKHNTDLNAMIFTWNAGETGGVSATTTVSDATIVLIEGYLFGSNAEANSKSSYNTTFDNCRIITAGSSIIKNLSSKNTVTFNNCVTNGTIKATGDNNGTVIVKNTVCASNTYAAPEGYVNAAWNVPMSLGEGVETLTVHSITTATSEKNSPVVLKPYVIAIGTYDANANIKLPALAVNTAPVDKTVEVTFDGIGNNPDVKVLYAKGGNVAAQELDPYTSDLFVVKHTGEFKEPLAVNVESAVTYTPVVKAVSNVTGLMANLTLYSDFGVNLYIPAKYGDNVRIDGLETELTMGGKYLYARKMVSCDEADKPVSFELHVHETIGDDDFEAVCTVELSILEYAEIILGSMDGTYTYKDKVLVYNVLNYANEASRYFSADGKTENAAIRNVLDKYRERIGYVYTADETLDRVVETDKLSSVLKAATISLESSPTFAFTVKQGFKGTITVSFANGEYVIEDFKDTAAVEDTVVNVSGIRAFNIGTVLNICAVGEIDGLAVEITDGKFSLDTYISDAIRNGQTEAAALTIALKLYADVAEMYKNGTLDSVVTEAGTMTVKAPDVIYTNYNGKPVELIFSNPDFKSEAVYTISDDRVKIENGLIFAKGSFPTDTVVHVGVKTKDFDAEFTVTVKTYSPDFIEKNCQAYEKTGIIDNAVKGGTVFVGDSYFTETYWKDFYTDFAGENAYLLGIGGSIVEEWFMASERLLYPLEPSEVMVHLGFNDIYGSAAHLTAEEVGAQLVALLTMYHENLPNATIYYCSVESSKWSNTYERSFTTAIEVNDIVKALAEKNDWLVYVNTRYIFCNDTTKEVYGDGDGNANDDDDTGIYGRGSHPSVIAYDEYKRAIDIARGKIQLPVSMTIKAPDVIYTNYSGKPLEITFGNPKYDKMPTFFTSDERVTVKDGKVSAKGTFSTDTVVTISAVADGVRAECTVTVSTYSPGFMEKHCLMYENNGTIANAKPGGLVFVGDSYFTEGCWSDFYQDYARENAYIMGLGGSVIEQWLMASERILYPMNPSEVVVHLGFNDIYNEKSANYNASASDIAAQLIQLFDMYHENMPNATVYFCSIESSKWHKNPGQNLYERSFGVAVDINKIIEEYAENNSWLEYVNTRVIFCDDENKIIYDDGDGNTDDDDTTGRYCGGSHPSLSSYDKYYELINEARRKHWLEES